MAFSTSLVTLNNYLCSSIHTLGIPVFGSAFGICHILLDIVQYKDHDNAIEEISRSINGNLSTLIAKAKSINEVCSLGKVMLRSVFIATTFMSATYCPLLAEAVSVSLLSFVAVEVLARALDMVTKRAINDLDNKAEEHIKLPKELARINRNLATHNSESATNEKVEAEIAIPFNAPRTNLAYSILTKNENAEVKPVVKTVIPFDLTIEDQLKAEFLKAAKETLKSLKNLYSVVGEASLVR